MVLELVVGQRPLVLVVLVALVALHCKALLPWHLHLLDAAHFLHMPTEVASFLEAVTTAGADEGSVRLLFMVPLHVLEQLDSAGE